jgi:hypothetical protein
MIAEKPPEERQHWTVPEFIAPGMETPPVGVWIDKDVVCRNCMKVAEEITMRRGFIDFISGKEAEEKEYICTRCSNKIPTGT